MMSKYYWQNIKGQPKIMINKISLGFLLLIAFTTNLNAQCAMCKAAVEADLKEGGSAGAGLNEGILDVMAPPYIALFFSGVMSYVHRRKKHIV